ncbi:SHC-transforming protein 2 isoform X1 [Huso huso]|uniref:SHC-transforming protein 2 isoform X1 n=1 Tax=Huso huso TaxID=61971 RepID=A0ABR0Y4W3_HUSHU
MLLKPKYGRFRNDSVTSSDDLMQSLAMSGKVVATPVPSASPSARPPPPPPLPPPERPSCPLAEPPCPESEQDAATTFCMLIPRIPQWKFSNASSFLSRSPSSSSSSSSKDLGGKMVGPGANGAATGPVASLAAVLNSCDPICVTPCSLQAMHRLRGGGAGAGGPSGSAGSPGAQALDSGVSGATGATGVPGSSRGGRVAGMRLASEGVTQKGSFINKPTQGWLHPDKKIMGPGAAYIVRYMGCIEVLKSMRSLDFNTRTQVTREAINRLYEAVPGVKGVWKKKAANKALLQVMGKSNLRFAGMTIAVNISIDGLNLMMPTTRQVIANHPMQSISFASGGDTDTPDYVAYVAKDPVNQRACHILECCDGLAQSIISTIGQAFELQFKQYLHSPPKAISAPDRIIGVEESAWGDDEDSSEHDYYNSIPGKEPPVGGLVDSRLRPGAALLGHVHTQPCRSNRTPQFGSPVRRAGCQNSGPPCYETHWETDSQSSSVQLLPVSCPGLTSDGYLCADGRPPGCRDYEEHLYVNTQSLENWEPGSEGAQESPKKDLFDMRPFEDALKLHEAGGESPALEDAWPSPPRRRAPIAPTEEQLRHEPWYHGRMSRRDAEKLLAMDGDFLVRDSVTNPGQYVLTGMHSGLPKHLLLVDPEGVVRTKDVLFDSISHLISYHLQDGLPIVAAESELHLKQVVRRKQ